MLTQMFRSYARWRLSRNGGKRGAAVQRDLLARLLRDAGSTRFGRDHGFRRIRDVEDFQRRVPLRDYEDFWRAYWSTGFPVLKDVTSPGLVETFALTSGTTSGTTKYIPYNRAMGRAACQGMLDLLSHHVLARPESRFLAGAAIMLSGSETLNSLSPGVAAGDVSALAAMQTPRLLRKRLLPTPDVASLDDWEAKIERIAELSRDRRITALGGSPNWLLMFLDAVARDRPGTNGLADWYPDLDLIVHGGVNFAPYRNRMHGLMSGGHAETREVYSASEGFFAVADRGDGEGMRLIPDGNIFYEFVPVEDLNAPEPVRHWLGNIEPGVEYAVVISSAAGLWAYNLGDTVRFVATAPPRLLVTGRTSYRLSAFGEHLIEEELAEGVTAAARAIGADVAEYCCTARVASGDEGGGFHEFAVECRVLPRTDIERKKFANALDARLAELNDDYRSLRNRDYNLRKPRIDFVHPGEFARWMKRHRGLGGQNKVPRIVHDADTFDRIVTEMQAGRPGTGK